MRRVRESDGPEGERVATVASAVESALADQMMDGFGGMPEDPNDVVVNDLMVREFRSRAEFPTWISRECIVRIYSVVRSQGYRIEHAQAAVCHLFDLHYTVVYFQGDSTGQSLQNADANFFETYIRSI